MKLIDEIIKLTDSAIQFDGDGCSDTILKAAKLYESELDAWYCEKKEPDYRLIKILTNLMFYLEETNAEITFRSEILSAIAKTLLKTAEYDFYIRENPEKVKERNDNILSLCEKLSSEEKKPDEEMSDKPYDVTIFLATYNQLELTKLCLESIFENTDDVSYELYLIDNGSSDGTYEYFKNDSRIKLIRLTENTGLLLALHIFYESGLDNGKFWLYMNNDIVVTPRWASNMLKCIKSDPCIASVLPVTNRAAEFLCISPPFGLYDVEQVQEFGEHYNISNPNMWQDWLMHYGYVTLIRPSVRRKLGYFEDCFYFPFYFSDGDIILSQTKAGYRAVQARDTYVHHFDGGHTVLQTRRTMLAAGEKLFFEKYGFFPTDLEKNIPASISTDAGAKILFLGASRAHALMQLQSVNKTLNIQNIEYFAADTMEQLKFEQFDKSVRFQEMDNWYEVQSIFEGVEFDAVIYSDDIMKLRHPKKFLSAVLSRLKTNGKLHFLSEPPGNLLTLNNVLLSRRTTPRDAVRIRKINTSSVNELVALLYSVGFSADSVEEVYYNESYTFANMETIASYRELFKGEDMAEFERNIRIRYLNITARKPGIVDTENTLEQLLYAKKETK